MRNGAKTKVKRKSVITYSIPILVLMLLISIIGIKISNEGNKENYILNNKIAVGYMSEEIQQLIDSDDKNLQSQKYLITDTTIERIKEDTSVEDLKKEIGKNVKIYKDEKLIEEVQDGIIKTGMLLEDRNNMYNLIVSGDVNKDGKVNQIDLSKMIIEDTYDITALKASEFGEEKIIQKIVYGSYDFEKIDEIKSPEIEIISGELGKNEWYTSDVEVIINQKDENGEKTVYKIKGTEEKDLTLIKENEKITLTKDGVYKIIACTYAKEGNKSQVTEKIIKVNKTGIEASISYNITTETTDPVIATVNFNKKGITITNNNGNNTYEFTKNGEFTFEYTDETGRVGNIKAKVDWIKAKEIVGKDGNWKYFVKENNTIQLTQYLGNNTEVIVPANYDGYEVYAVGYQNPKGKYINIFGNEDDTKITQITLEEGIQRLEYCAFSSCRGLNQQLILPQSLNFIGNSAFYYCSNLKGELKIPNNVEVIDKYAFEGCNNLTGDLVIPDSVKEISQRAFLNCTGLNGELILSKNLNKIEDSTFYNCNNLKGDLIIPDSVTSIGYAAFYKCFGLNGKLKLSQDLEKIGDYAFSNCNNLTGDLIIPNNVKSIGIGAFYVCINFNGIFKLSNALEKISYNSFAGCNNLKGDLIIPDSVTIIEDQAFYNCYSFNGSLILSQNLKTIGKNVFYSCKGLTGDLIIPDSVTNIGDASFYKCVGFDGKLKLSNNLNTIEYSTFRECSNLTGDLIIPDNVTIIDDSAFSTCSSMNGKLKLSNNLKTIGDFAFNECNKLTGDLIIPDSVTNIGGAAFQLCIGFDGELILSNNLEEIGNYVFSKCTSLNNITIKIPSSLKKIGEDYILDGQNVGIGSHFAYNVGNDSKKFENYEVDVNNEYFKAVNGVLYTKDGKRLISYPRNKKDKTYEILEGVQLLDQMSIASNMMLETLIIPDSLMVENSTYPGFTVEDEHLLNSCLYSYNAIQNIVAKETNPNYKSVDGVLYTKDLKEMVYVSSGRTNEVILPEGVETIKDDSVYWSQVGRKISKMYIPQSVVNISDNTIQRINSFVKIVEVSENNPVFTVDANNKLIKK